MEWFDQGHNNGLCGFYAALNAISYLLKRAGRPIVEAKRQAFFDSAVDCLMEDKRLAGGSALRILKGDTKVGGIFQSQIAGLCERIADHEGLAVRVEEKPEKSGPVDLKKMFTNELDLGNAFAMIVSERGGGHWVVVAPHQRRDCFTLIDNARPIGCRIVNKASDYVAGESIIVRLA